MHPTSNRGLYKIMQLDLTKTELEALRQAIRYALNNPYLSVATSNALIDTLNKIIDTLHSHEIK